jgi:hypothetical protein
LKAEKSVEFLREENAMINKIENLFLILLIALIIGGTTFVSAQNGGDKILVAGEKPLRQTEIDQIIEFYEWMFETSFSSDERQRFAELSIKAFRQNASESRKNTDTLISAVPVFKTKSAERQKSIREEFNRDFVNQLRTDNDEAAQLLLGIYERGQAGQTNQDAAVDPNQNPSTGQALTNNLIGRWKRSGGAGGFRDTTGKTKYNSGDDLIFEFHNDGTMQFINEKNTLSITQCRITETTKIPGKFSVSDGQLTMDLGVGTSVGTSTCEKSGNFKKTLSASSVTKNFIVKELQSVFRPDRPLILCFDDSKDEDCFEKEIK